MATIYQQGEQLLVALTPEEAQQFQSGDTVRVIKVDSQQPLPDLDRLIEQTLQDFATGLDYLKDK